MPYKMNYRDTIEAGKIIEAHCKLVDGYAVYEEGWSDNRVHKTLLKALPGRKIGIKSIANMRRDVIGRLKTRTSIGLGNATSERLDVLEGHIMALKDIAHTHMNRIGSLKNELEMMIGHTREQGEKIERHADAQRLTTLWIAGLQTWSVEIDEYLRAKGFAPPKEAQPPQVPQPNGESHDPA